MSGAPTALAIARMGNGGDGIGTLPDGSPCFVAGALPGERVLAEPAAARGEGHAAILREIVTPSPDRVAPPCPHVAQGCGGCAVQHWAPAAVAAWKRARVIEALQRAGFTEPAVAPTVTVAAGTRRRADFALRRAADGSVTLGFHRRGSGAVIATPGCRVLAPRLVALMAPLAQALRGLSALRREGSAIVNLLDDGADVLLRTDGPLDAAGRAALARFAASEGLPRIAWAQRDGVPETAAQLRSAALTLSGAEVAPPPGAFLQAAPDGEAAIVAAVLAGLPAKLPGRGRIADLYAGLGTLSIPLARRGRVAAIEGEAAAVAALAAAAARAGLPLAATRRDLARQPLTARELAPFAAVVLDPPFAGAAAQCAQIARAKVPRVIYVSCNPAALSRDLRVLSGVGYRLLGATPIDQFLWSAQVEAVAVLAV